MKKFDQVSKKAGRRVKRHELIAGAAIFLFILLHYVSPFIFIRDENPVNELMSLQTEKTENEQSAPIVTEYKTEDKAEYKQQSAKTIKAPDPFAPIAKPVAAQTKTAPRPTLKKKEPPPRESRAERLRRAERILTGV